MSIRQGNDVIAGHINYHPDLFDHKWADHLLNDVSWLRADTFSWQDGGVYEAAYNHLADDISGKSLSSETISGVTVQFYLADDGHKICPDSQESNVASIFTATGVAWYYIIDTANERFKLPRINPDKAKIINSASVSVKGTGKSLGLTDGTNNFGLVRLSGGSAIKSPLNAYNVNVGSTASDSQQCVGVMGLTTDDSKSGLTGTANLAGATSYFAGAKYLYFYVGNFTQTALENTAGLNAELFNSKADLSYTNAQLANKVDKGHQVIAFQAPTAGNNYTWYRKYADGWVEQGGGGTLTNSGSTTNLIVEMANTNYFVSITKTTGSTDHGKAEFFVSNRTTISFTAKQYDTVNMVWEVKGMAA